MCFAQIQPRHAVIYHFFNDFDTAPEMERDVRKHYQGRCRWRRI